MGKIEKKNDTNPLPASTPEDPKDYGTEQQLFKMSVDFVKNFYMDDSLNISKKMMQEQLDELGE